MTNDQLAARLDDLASKTDLVLLRQDELQYEINTVKKILTGNGEPSRGLILRFDRVEQSYLSNKKFAMGMMIAAGAGLLSLFGSISLLLIRIRWGI